MSANELKIKRALSVNQRLLTIGAASILSIAAMIGVGWYQHNRVEGAMAAEKATRDAVAKANAMKVAKIRLVLAANDTIIDKDEKKVDPSRAAIMTSTIELLKTGAPVVHALAAATGQADLTQTYEADVGELDRVIVGDLQKLVVDGAPESAFAKIDNTIDGAGDRLGKVFEALTAEGKILADKSAVEAQTSSAWALYWQMIVGLCGLALMGVLFPIHSAAIRRGVASIRGSLERIRNDELDAAVEGKDRGDEFGAMAQAADSLRQAALDKRAQSESNRRERERNEMERAGREAAKHEEEAEIRVAVDSLATGLSHLADGDLTISIDQPFRADLERVRGDFNRAVQNLQKVISEVKGNSGSIEANAHQMRTAADDLAKRTEQQAASLEETSAALEQITATVRNSSVRADEANKMVDGTRVNAEESGKVVSEAMAAMERIETASNEIGKIINVIDEIAFQTNLLALNAGVEAARAGEAGKGFAVVAQEVRELAGRAAGAAKDIKTLVARSSSEVRTGVQLVTATRDQLSHIVTDVGKINELVHGIATAANEQSTGIQEINTAIGQMDQMTQQNAAMVEQTNAASHTLAQDAGGLTQLMSQFRIGEPTPVQRSAPHMSAAAPKAASSKSYSLAPKPATVASRPRVSPARNLVDKLAGAFQSKPTTAAASGGSNSNNWEEF
jgi:methyl-accepting chemotaxis protein